MKLSEYSAVWSLTLRVLRNQCTNMGKPAAKVIMAIVETELITFGLSLKEIAWDDTKARCVIFK